MTSAFGDPGRRWTSRSLCARSHRHRSTSTPCFSPIPRSSIGSSCRGRSIGSVRPPGYPSSPACGPSGRWAPNLQSIDDLWKFPAYDVDDIRRDIEENPPFGTYQGVGTELAFREPQRLYFSGGTTGKVRPTLYTQSDERSVHCSWHEPSTARVCGRATSYSTRTSTAPSTGGRCSTKQLTTGSTAS